MVSPETGEILGKFDNEGEYVVDLIMVDERRTARATLERMTFHVTKSTAVDVAALQKQTQDAEAAAVRCSSLPSSPLP
jgi:hypothetical protein